MLATPILWALIALSAFATSVLSGIVGMAGGMVLLIILITLLPVSSAMLLHAATQLTANGSRAFMLKEHILWGLLPLYLLGSVTAIGIATYLVLIPEPAWVLILIGVFAWAGRWSQRLQGLNITKPVTTIFCGFVVTFAQLIAGAAGPLLDLFYLNSGLGRQSIVANKALTQTIGHGLRITYYGVLINVDSQLAWWLFPLVILAAVLGTRTGVKILARWHDVGFQRISQQIILVIATFCILRGVYLLMPAGTSLGT
jgi:uncharacterized membrane protein YfcA